MTNSGLILPAEAERAYLDQESARWQHRVEERVRDWLDRLQRLNETVRTWVDDLGDQNLSVADAGAVLMNEELMQRYGIPPVDMNAFSVFYGTTKLATFRPKGLWIVGANGRVDIVTPNEAPILVDESEHLTRPERWHLYSSDKRSGVEFNRETFFSLLGIK